jgi:hypothetical protein
MYRGNLGAAKRLAQLMMDVEFDLVGKTQTLEVPNIVQAGKVESWIGGFRYVIRDVSKISDGTYTCTAEVFRGARSRADFGALTSMLQRRGPQLLDAQVQRLLPRGGSSHMGPDDYGQSFTISSVPLAGAKNGQQIGEPAKLVWEVPAETRYLVLPVELTDVPLP